MRKLGFLLVLSGGSIAGCGGEAFQAGEPPPAADAAADASAEVSGEAAAEAAPESSSDAPEPEEAEPDSAPDVAPEAAPDVTPDGPGTETGCGEGQQVSCYEGPDDTEGKGVCKAGTSTCTGGAWGPCTGQILPSEDLCNELDDDCSGVADENCECTPGTSEDCGSDIGECEPGTRTCQTSGTWGSCQGSVGPKPEVCDGKDNNCNNSTDEGISGASCYSGPDDALGKGPCKAGTLACSSGVESCAGEVLPVAEICGNGIDENCDGADQLCPACTEAQPLKFPSACGQSCVGASNDDTDCDGMKGGDPTPTTCNPLTFFDGFKGAPDPSRWTLGGTTGWECGEVMIGPSSNISTASAMPTAYYVVEARVKLKDKVAGDWSVGISSAVDTNQRRTCELWVSTQWSSGKLQAHTNVKTSVCDNGNWSSVAGGLDPTPGKVYILRLLGDSANKNTCQVLDETGTQVLATTYLNCAFPTPGRVTAYANVRAALVDYVSIYGW